MSDERRPGRSGERYPLEDVLRHMGLPGLGRGRGLDPAVAARGKAAVDAVNACLKPPSFRHTETTFYAETLTWKGRAAEVAAGHWMVFSQNYNGYIGDVRKPEGAYQWSLSRADLRKTLGNPRDLEAFIGETALTGSADSLEAAFDAMHECIAGLVAKKQLARKSRKS